MNFCKNVLRSKLLFSQERICLRSWGLITKSLKQKYCCKITLPSMLSKNLEKKRKKKSQRWREKSERPMQFVWQIKQMALHHRLSPESTKIFRATVSKNTFGELLLVLQLFEEFALEIRYFIFKFQKSFFYRIFKNG